MLDHQQQDCSRCQGTGRVATKGHACAVLCSCPAGRAFASGVRVFLWPYQVTARKLAEVPRG